MKTEADGWVEMRREMIWDRCMLSVATMMVVGRMATGLLTEGGVKTSTKGAVKPGPGGCVEMRREMVWDSRVISSATTVVMGSIATMRPNNSIPRTGS